MKKVLAIAMALTLAVSVAACQRKSHLEVKDMSQISKSDRAVVVKTITLQNLEERVTKIENRLDVAKAARARAAAGQTVVPITQGKVRYTPAPKYDPNFLNQILNQK